MRLATGNVPAFSVQSSYRLKGYLRFLQQHLCGPHSHKTLRTSSIFFGLQIRSFVIIPCPCHLTSVSHSGRNPELWKDIGLQQKPDTKNDKNNSDFHLCFAPYCLSRQRAVWDRPFFMICFLIRMINISFQSGSIVIQYLPNQMLGHPKLHLYPSPAR